MKRINLALLLTFSLSSHAATLVLNGNGQLTGATGVDVDGALYDVTFLSHYCCGVNSIEFTDIASAEAATLALSEQVIVGDHLQTPLNVYGIILDEFSRFGRSEIATPYLTYIDENQVAAYRILGVSLTLSIDESGSLNKIINDNWYGAEGDSAGAPPDLASYGNFIYATWTPVPIPATALLFGSALAGLLLARRNK